MMLRITSCGVGSLVALMASACQLVPNPALADGDASTGSDATTSGSTSTGPLGSTSTGPQGSTSTGPAEQLWCMDADADGFGDPTMCMQAVDMPPGTVDDDEDCDDGNPDTFPGAAPNDSLAACMHDEDGDDWGDDTPSAGVDSGTDCDDGNGNAFPGAAENEMVPDLCMLDEDGDGWGDASPSGGGGGGGGGPVAGSDCYDGNPILNPDTVRLTVFLPYDGGPVAPRNINFVNDDASLDDFVLLLTPMGGVPDVNIASATFNEDLEIFGNDLTSVQLQSVDYARTCGALMGTITPVGAMPYGPPGDTVCGLEFGSDGLLRGIGQTGDDLRTFDTTTGQIVNTIPIMLGPDTFDVSSCGMARDCTEGRLLLADGSNRTIYGIDEASGEATVLRDLSGFFPSAWSPTGLEYDPVTRTALLSTGTQLYRIDLDSADDPELMGDFGPTVSNLAYLPICSP